MVSAHKRSGFTLIELLVAVAIVGILVSVAIPQFSSYRAKSHNTAAFSDLRNFKQFMESSHSDTQIYPTMP